MNIKAAAEKTGLTKRAIKYYEIEGLITPLKNIENNYREYTCQDVIKSEGLLNFKESFC
ncbi:MerR family DNA-binding transcriptional regulator [Clostridium tagluense]|uniref:MerR family DNA-binding transcriptional regulator n=1 Tax=Clostridium tagluense TaxID=360422 RepID=UPI001CF2E3A0|nr:MerR family DNA-binding transcriptional regulator [Clostridium tagluense]MCB2297979.1 MerR family DNA-binding transcriptional regulator [Clostridium tagluense]